MSWFEPLLDWMRGRALTVAPMDGALRPNAALDEAERIVAAPAPDNLAVLDGKLIYSSGCEIRQAAPEAALMNFESEVTALAVSERGDLAVGLDNGELRLGERRIASFNCVTALAFHGGALYICNGSADHAPSQWVRDLMGLGASGSLWRYDLNSGRLTQLAQDLRYPYGVAVDAEAGRLFVSESWAHRLIAIPLDGGKPREALARLPGYPARLQRAGAGFLLSLFAPLNRLVEFVLQEPAYRLDMMREVESRDWIAPTLAPAARFLEPLQKRAVRSMGVHKPWSPTRSYGLVVRLDRRLRPLESYHSRANGRLHGVTSALLHDGSVVVASKGGDCIARLAIREGAR